MSKVFIPAICLAYFLAACHSMAPAVPPSQTETMGRTNTPELTALLTADGAPMVFVPAGEFTMGSDLMPNEKPIHTVALDAFRIDTFETTNALYQKCVAAQECRRPLDGNSGGDPGDYYGNPAFDQFPVNLVAWDDAGQYCRWAGKRLPTEAEWEKAARGTDARIFPWGNTFDPDRANSALNYGLVTTAVGSHPSGASPYGAQDMAGNVWEWAADWYDETYYAHSPQANPSGPLTGTMRIVRGGGYGGYDAGLRSSQRRDLVPDEHESYIGFRCVQSIH